MFPKSSSILLKNFVSIYRVQKLFPTGRFPKSHMSSGVALSSIVIMHGIGLNRTILHKYIEAIILKILDYLCVALKNSPFAPLGSGEAPTKYNKNKGFWYIDIRTLCLCILSDSSFLGTLLIIGEGRLLDSYPVRGLSS